MFKDDRPWDEIKDDVAAEEDAAFEDGLGGGIPYPLLVQLLIIPCKPKRLALRAPPRATNIL